MRSIIGAVIVGGLVYWWYQQQQRPAPQGTQVVNQPGGIMYDRPIGPGLEGVTNVGKMTITERDAPMGTFAKW